MAGKASSSAAATVSSLDSQQQLAASGSSMVDNHQLVNLNNNSSSNNNTNHNTQNNTSTNTANEPNNKNSNNNNNNSSSHLKNPENTIQSANQLQGSSGSQSSQKRPMNAFLIFCKRHRSVVKSKYPHLENRSITKILGEWWAALDAEQKQIYTELARQYKEAFMKANPHFKWYKTDSFIPGPPLPPTTTSHSNHMNSSPVMSNNTSSSSPPPSVTGIKKIIAGITNASQTTASVTASVVSETTKNNINEKSIKDSIHVSSDQNSCSLKENKVGNPTPKPPKKRYLETSEFKATVAATTAAASTSVATTMTATTAGKEEQGTTNSASSNIPTPVSIQPVLSASTMSRIIEDALDGGPSLPPSSYLDMNEIKTAAGVSLDSPSRSPPSPERVVMNGHVGGLHGHSPPHSGVMVNGVVSSIVGLGIIPISSESSSVSSLTAKSLLIAESQQPIGSATAAIQAASSANKNSLPLSVNAQNAHQQSFHALSGIGNTVDDDEEMEEEQDDDKPLNLSSSKVLRASNQQIIDHFIDKLLTTGGECGEGNPMPVEMMEHTSSSIPVSVAPIMTSSNVKSHNIKSGKGSNKRLNHEMNSEVSMKSLSPSSESEERQGSHLLSNVGNNVIGTAVTLVNGGSSSSSCSSNSSAKRPKSNSMSSSGSSSSTTSSHEDNIKSDHNNSSPAKSSSGGGSKWVSGEFDLEERIAALPQLQDTHLINALNHKSSEKLIAINGSRSSASSHNNHHHSNQHHSSIPVSIQSGNSLVDSMEVGPCDGLTALAEVALSQAKQAITTSSSS